MFISSYEEFEKKINSILEGIIIISGDEKYLINKSVQKLLNTITTFPELNIVNMQGNTVTRDALEEACETLPVMSDRKIVFVNGLNVFKKADKRDDDEAITGVQSKPGDIEEYLISLSKDTQPGLLLLITIDGDENERSKFIITVKNNGYIVKYRQLRGDELFKAVNNLFKNRNKVISKSDLLYFLSETGNSLQEIEMEIDKLSSYIGNEVDINRADIDAVVHRGLESNIFKMVDSIGRKDAQNALTILDNLLFQKENPLKILGMITRQYRMLLFIKLYLNDNMDFNQIKNKLNIKKDFILQNFAKQSKNFRVQDLKKAMHLCINADINMKTGRYEDSMALEILVVELCK